MHWEVLIVPLIALGVWILGTIFKTGEDERAKQGIRRPGGGAGRGPARRPVTDLDRFLEEARRRRETEETRKAIPEPPPRPKSSPPPETRRVPLSERPSALLERPDRPVPTARRTEEVLVAIPIALPATQPTARMVVLEAGVVPRSQPSAEPAPIAPTTTRDMRISPIVQQVRALLSKPQTAGTAFVLREIFDRPLSQRRR